MKGNKNGVRLTGIILIGLVVVILGGAGCQDDSRPNPDPGNAVANQLAAKYGAKTSWEEGLDYFAFTLEVQERLVTGKPTLFKVSVSDVFLRDGRTFVHFIPRDFFPTVDYVLELECSRPIVELIVKQKSDDPYYGRFLDEYALVASIEEVTKAVFGLNASALSDDEAEIEINHSGLLTASGSCIDIAYIP